MDRLALTGHLAVLALLLAAPSEARAAPPPSDTERPVEIGLAYYGHMLTHPGLVARVAGSPVRGERAALWIEGEFVNWWHVDNEYVFGGRAGLAGEVRSRRGTGYRLHLLGGVRNGVLATPVYDDSGARARRSVRVQGQWGAALEFVWPLRRAKAVKAISLQPELTFAHPSFYVADIDFGLRLGVLF